MFRDNSPGFISIIWHERTRIRIGSIKSFYKQPKKNKQPYSNSRAKLSASRVRSFQYKQPNMNILGFKMTLEKVKANEFAAVESDGTDCLMQCGWTFHTDAQPSSMCLLCIALDVFPHESILRLIQDREKFSSHCKRQKRENNTRTLNKRQMGIDNTRSSGAANPMINTSKFRPIDAFCQSCLRWWRSELGFSSVSWAAPAAAGGEVPFSQDARASCCSLRLCRLKA